MKYSRDRRIDDKVEELIREGWHVWRGAKHFRLQHPRTGFVLTIPGTPSDHRTVLNWFSQFNRAERANFEPWKHL